jgi:hypothetical protein
LAVQVEAFVRAQLRAPDQPSAWDLLARIEALACAIARRPPARTKCLLTKRVSSWINHFI